MLLQLYTDAEAILKASPTYQAQSSYHAMYSSVFSGIVTDPQFMSIPVDDHLVHRGDGVFEAFKMVQTL